MSHVFARYFSKHHHYPRIVVNSGVQKITVEFAPGYVSITTRPRGSTIYIVRSAWIELLRRSIPMTRRWTHHSDHDVPAAMHEAYEFERVRLQELRQQKKHRKVSWSPKRPRT